MTKKTVKAEIKAPDIVLRTLGSSYAFIRNNLKLCIIALAVCVAIASSVYGYMVYEKRTDDGRQYLLSQGLRSFEEFTTTGKQEDLSSAESVFNKIALQDQGRISAVAKLYLAKINHLRGKTDEALKVYKEVSQASSDPLLKSLADKAIAQIEKK
jgi:predicted negative regulator of RcsB-dependent stress response